jgi:hypothetical protein
MSWQIFKDNILSMANEPGSISDIDKVAKTYAKEYDAAVKRGKDVLNGVSLKKGNVDIMEALFKAALQKGLTSTAPYDLVGEMGKGVVAYWQGAQMNEFPIPIIPAIGSISNISVVSNSVTNPGTWAPAVSIPSVPGADSSSEGDAIQRDIQEEYPASQQAYEEQFASEEEAMANNSNVSEQAAYENVQAYNEEVSKEAETDDSTNEQDPTNGTSGTSGNALPDKPKPKLVGKGDEALFKKCGNGLWPALGEPGSFVIKDKQSAGGCDRFWYKVNNEYLKKNCTEIMFPTAGGDKKIMVHKDLAAIIKPALAKIKSSGLQQYIKSCDGGLAVRNVTCGSRFSNHSWGTAIDMNASVYPYGYKFKDNAIYSGKTKIRDLNEFDKGFQQVASVFKSQGMTWLSNNDPMHVSIYE